MFGPRPAPPSPADCASGTPIKTPYPVAVSGNGTYRPTNTAVALIRPGTYWWYASYSGDAGNAPSNSGCGTGMTSTVVSPTPADLSLANTGSPNPVTSGQHLTYTITAINTGEQDATGVTVTDPLPASATFGSFSTSQGSCTRTATATNKNKGGTVTCNLGTLAGGTLADGATATVTITVTPTVKGTLADTAALTASNVTGDSDEAPPPRSPCRGD